MDAEERDRRARDGYFEDRVRWGRRVLHKPTLAWGQCEHYYDGVRSKYDPRDGTGLVNDPVLRLYPEHHLVATDPHDFVDLSEETAGYAGDAEQMLAGVVEALAKIGRERGMESHEVLLVLRAALGAQLRALAE